MSDAYRWRDHLLLGQCDPRKCPEEINQAAVWNVRFGSLADILTSPRHVRFTPNNGRWAAPTEAD